MRGKGFILRRRQATALAIVLAGALATASPAHAITQKLAPASPAGAKAGTSVAIEGNVAVLGAETEESARGAAYVFTRTGDTWTQTSRLIASDRLADDRFGSAVAIDGDTIVVGAYRDDHAVGLGSVYTFPTAGTGTRTQSAKLTLSTGNTPAGLGRSVAIDGNTIVAGTDGIDNTGISHIYTFARTGGDRNQTAILTAPQVAFEHSFGASVDIDGDTIVAGDSSADPSGINSGALYTFTSTGSGPGTDGDADGHGRGAGGLPGKVRGD